MFFGSAALVHVGQPADVPQSVPAAPSEPMLTRDTRLEGGAIREDIAVLRRVYTELHPGLYRYNSSEQIAKGFDDLETRLGSGATVGETYLEISRFVSTIRCGHTYANFFNQKKPIREAVLEGQTRVPFAFRWVQGRMIVTEAWSGNATLVRGTEVLSINGVSSGRILSELLPLARADGANDAKRRQMLEVSGRERWEAFDIFFPLVFPWKGDELDLRVKTPSGGEAEIRVRALTRAERDALVKAATQPDVSAGANDASRPLPSGFNGWEYQVLPGNAAMLRMDGWALFNTDWKWADFLNKVMDDAIERGVTDLIIDIRANEGGLDCGDVLLSRLIDRELVLPAIDRRVRYRKIPDDLSKYLDTWDDSFRNWGERAKDPKDGMFTLANEPGDPSTVTIAPTGRRFAGKVWVLVGATNSSATFQFAYVIQQTKLGTLVGEPTGGNLRGINGGSFFFVRLPRTGIEVDLPLVALFPSRKPGEAFPPDAGLDPDIRVDTTAGDIAAGRDAAFERVLELIRDRR
jgi:hypothetical protein